MSSLFLQSDLAALRSDDYLIQTWTRAGSYKTWNHLTLIPAANPPSMFSPVHAEHIFVLPPILIAGFDCSASLVRGWRWWGWGRVSANWQKVNFFDFHVFMCFFCLVVSLLFPVSYDNLFQPRGTLRACISPIKWLWVCVCVCSVCLIEYW